MFSFRYMSVADIIPGACYGNIIKALPHGVQPPDLLTRDYLDSLNIGTIYGSSHNPVIIMTMPANIVAKYRCDKNIITSNTNMVLRMEQLPRISFHVKDKQIGSLESTTPLESAFTYNGYSWKYVASPLSGNYYTEIYSCFFILTVLNNIVKIELKTYSIEYRKDLIIKNVLTRAEPLTYLKIKETAVIFVKNFFNVT